MKERTLFMFKPGGLDYFNEVYEMLERTIEANSLGVVCEEHVNLTREQGLALYRMHEGEWYHSVLAKQVSGTQLFAMVIEGEDAVGIIKRLLGPTKPEEAKSVAPGTIRGQFPYDNYAECRERKEVVDNVAHASGLPIEADWEIRVVFPELFPPAE